jgi:hypothetical protein
MTARPFVMPLGRDALGHLPGEDGWPLVGHAIEFIRDSRGMTRRFHERYGTMYRTRLDRKSVV